MIQAAVNEISVSAAPPRPAAKPRLSDAEIVRLAAQILGDPRAWAAVGEVDPHGVIGRQVRARALALLAESLDTI